MTDKVVQIEMVAQRLRDLCNDEVERLEDSLPNVTNLFERDSILKEIDALHEMADEANRQAVFIVEKYYKEKEWK